LKIMPRKRMPLSALARLAHHLLLRSFPLWQLG
jgi:hypothetical protein